MSTVFLELGSSPTGSQTENNNIMADRLSIATLNCEGIRRSTDYIRNYLSTHNCDILCLQETWHLDDNIQYFNKIHTDYLFTAISGVNSKDHILPGRSKGGVAILYKKRIGNKVKPIISLNRRICGIIINFTPSFRCLLLSIYLPCDTHSINNVNDEYSSCIDYIKYMYNNEQCNGFICCGDFNTCFNRVNAQTQCLNDFVSRNNLAVSWDHENSVRDLTYVNTDLSHFSCIDHFIVSKNRFDCNINNCVVYDICNPSYHNLLLLTLSITSFNYIINARNTCTCDSKRTVNWKKASHENIADYKSHLDEKLISIKLSNDTYNCDDVHCKSIQHCQDFDYLCRSIINCCLEASVLAIPFVRSGNGDIPGWTEQVKPELLLSTHSHGPC